MKKDDRINQITEKTLELINKNGSVDSLRTKDLADAIGASEATIFKFFESNEEILNSVIDATSTGSLSKFKLRI